MIVEVLFIVSLSSPVQEQGDKPVSTPVAEQQEEQKGPPEAVPAQEAPAPASTTPQEGPRQLVARGEIKPFALQFDHPYGFDEINQALEAIAARAPHLTKLESIGTSAQGKPLRVLTLSDPAGGKPEDKPAILMLDYSSQGNSCGAETALAFVQTLLDEAARAAAREKAGKPVGEGFPGLRDVTPADLQAAMDEYGQDLGGFLGGSDPRQILRDFTVIIAPALDPDGRAPALLNTNQDEVEYDLNFPLGWRPDSLRPGSGHYPFSKPETQALAAYLAACPNLALVLGIIDGEARIEQNPWPGSALPAGDREVFRKLGGIGFLSAAAVERQDAGLRPSGVLAPWGSFGSQGGGLFDYAFQRFGIYPVAWSPPVLSADALVSQAEYFSSSVRAMALQSVTLLGALPRIRIEKDGLLELAPGLWQLDLAVRNSGVLPTLSSLGEMRRVSGDMRLILSGAKLLATGLREGDHAAFQVVQLESSGNMVSMGEAILGSGETRWLRLVLEGEQGSPIELVGSAARGGATHLKFTLN